LYSEKIKQLIIFDEIGQLFAGMTFIQLQLPLNVTAIYHGNEIIEANLNRTMNTEFKSKIPQAFSKAIKTRAVFLRRLHRKMDKFRNVEKIFQMAEFFQNEVLVTPCTNHPLSKRRNSY
jgi:hypothetical protein